MARRRELVILLVPAVIMVIAIVGILAFLIFRAGEAAPPKVGLTAEAALESPSGDSMGTVTFRQAASGVLIMADVKGLTSRAATPSLSTRSARVRLTLAPPATTSTPPMRNTALSIRPGSVANRVKDTAATCPISTPHPTVLHAPTSLRLESHWTQTCAIPYLTRMAPPSSCMKSPIRMEKRRPIPATA